MRGVQKIRKRQLLAYWQIKRAVAKAFFNGAGVQAERMILTNRDKQDLGGWAPICLAQFLCDQLAIRVPD